MLHRLILRVKKFQLPPPNCFSTVVKNMSAPRMSDRVNVSHLRPVPVYLFVSHLRPVPAFVPNLY